MKKEVQELIEATEAYFGASVAAGTKRDVERIIRLHEVIAAARASERGWIDCKQELPPFKRSRQDRTVGVHGKEYLVRPKPEGSSTAFYGTRASDEPNFYLHGRVIDVEFYRDLPSPPLSAAKEPIE